MRLQYNPEAMVLSLLDRALQFWFFFNVYNSLLIQLKITCEDICLFNFYGVTVMLCEANKIIFKRDSHVFFGGEAKRTA